MKAKTKAHNKSYTILIVEDSPTQALQVKRILEEEGFTTAVCRNGKEALSYLKELKPTIIISGIVMPEMDGYELCSAIKKDETLKDIPVILLTVLSSPKDVIKGLQSGADNFITKPYKKKFLLSLIQDILANQEVRKKGTIEVSLEIYFMGQKHTITSNSMQIIGLLFSTYEHAVFQNRELKKTQAELKTLNKQLEDKAKQRTQRIETLNSLLQAIRAINQLILREKDRDRLIKEACKTLTTAREHHTAWIALVDESGELLTTAEAGLGKEFLPLQRLLESGKLVSCARQALKKSGVVLVEDPSTACADCPLAKTAHARAAMAIRLEYAGKTYGLLSVSIPKDLVKDKEEVSLFEEAAGDIAFALYNIEAEQERKQAEEALLESESQYRSIFNSAIDSFLIFDLDGNIVAANPQACKIYGYTYEELIKLSGKDIVHPDCHHLFEQFKRDVQAIGEFHAESVDVRKDGTTFNIEVKGSAFDYKGKPHLLAVLRDISERKIAERALREAYGIINKSSSVAFTWQNQKGWPVEFVSENVENLFGYTAKNFMTGEVNYADCVHPEDLERVAKEVAEFSGKAETTEFTPYRIIAKDGSEKIINDWSYIVRDNDGHITHYKGIVEDITNRKQAEENLRRERDLMARIMETSPVCIIMVNSEGQITFANPGAEEVLGLSPDEVTGRAFNSPEWRITDYDGNPFPDEQLPFRRVMDTGLPVYDVRHAIEWPDGRRVLLSANGAPLSDKAGNIEGMIYALQDVTEQVKTSKALKESESLYRLHFENVSDIIYSINRELKVINISPSVETILGYKAEELIGKPFQELNLLVPEYLEKAATDTMLVFEGKRIPATEYQFLARDGTRKWGEVSGAPLIKDGQVVAVISVARDITDRKLAEQKIKDYADNLEAMVEERTKELNRALYDTEQARDRIDGILKSVGDGLIVTDLYNRVILMNRAAEDLLGARLSEVIDRPVDFAIDDKTLRERIKNTLDKKQEGYEFDFELSGKDGENPRILRARTSLITDKSGTHTGIITTMHDVTYEREVDRMKTEFISTAAHELRTPLTSIQGFSELLTTRDDITEEEKKECLSYINAQSVNLANIINDLLDISRIESGKGFSLNKAPCNIAELIREIVPSFQVLSKKHRFDLILPEEPIEVMADIDKMRQVFDNILSNAVKYSPEGGAVRLTVKTIAEFGMRSAELGEMEKRPAIEVAISDEGIGMSPEQVEKIFEKFYRADYSNTAIPGTGLGMSIVKYLVEAHGGEVWVESPSTEFIPREAEGLRTGKKGKGTTVRFTIPV